MKQPLDFDGRNFRGRRSPMARTETRRLPRPVEPHSAKLHVPESLWTRNENINGNHSHDQ